VNQRGLEPWNVDERAFPTHGSAEETLRYLAEYAVLAPSIHNCQPWAFALRDGALELYADLTTALTVVDPEHRELTISCGAALFNLQMAARHFGYEAHIEPFPDPRSPDLLAVFRLGETCSSTPDEERLFYAIPKRHTNRFPFEERQLPDGLLSELRAAAGWEGAWLQVLAGKEMRAAAFALIADGDRRQYADRRFRRELASWVHPNPGLRRDGMPEYVFGIGGLLSYTGPVVIGSLELGRIWAGQSQREAEGSPVLSVLGTESDSPADWLAAGKALERVLLCACAHGVSASFLNQPIQEPDLRLQLRLLMAIAGYPQLLLRLGYGPDVRPTPRRPVCEVLCD
jgi:nitroreductase